MEGTISKEHFLKEMDKYKYVQFVVPDIHCVPRGKLFSGRFKRKTAEEGYEIANAVCIMGPRGDFTKAVSTWIGPNWPNHPLRPCVETLTPWPWVGEEGRRTGNVICDLCFPDGSPDPTSPRQLLKAQLDNLWERHGLIIKSAFEYEFTVFHKDSLEPLGERRPQCWDMRVWGDHEKLFSDLNDVLEAVGVEVSSLMPEYPPGQWEMTTEPVEGLRGGDTGFYVKNAVKGFFQGRGYHASFMSRASATSAVNGMHLNHSLWKPRPSGDGEDNVFLNRGSTGQDNHSITAQHWMAGLLAHAPALCAVLCPTINCYRRLFNIATPSKIVWGFDDRFGLIRLRSSPSNVFMENRLPSGAANPYLALAVTIAAGMDGLNRKLQLPPPRDTEETSLLKDAEHTAPPEEHKDAKGQPAELPRSLAEALVALETDKELRELLEDRFVDCYIRVKRDLEVQVMEKANLTTDDEKYEFERKQYFHVF